MSSDYTYYTVILHVQSLPIQICSFQNACSNAIIVFFYVIRLHIPHSITKALVTSTNQTGGGRQVKPEIGNWKPSTISVHKLFRKCSVTNVYDCPLGVIVWLQQCMNILSLTLPHLCSGQPHVIGSTKRIWLFSLQLIEREHVVYQVFWQNYNSM